MAIPPPIGPESHPGAHPRPGELERLEWQSVRSDRCAEMATLRVMKTSAISWSLIAGIWLGIGAVLPAARADGGEATALRRASGVYGMRGRLQDGFFNGTVGYSYSNESGPRD
jgi:hypothetical protein